MELYYDGSRTIAPEKNYPNPNPNHNWGAIFLGGNCPDTIMIYEALLVILVSAQSYLKLDRLLLQS